MAVKSSNIGRAVRSMRLRCSSSSNDLEELGLDPLLHKRARRRRSALPEPLLDDEFTSNNILSCVGLSSNKRAKNLVTLLVGEEQRAFRVEPQILDHGVVQCLLEKTGSPMSEEEDDDDKENVGGCFNAYANDDGHHHRRGRRARKSSASPLDLISLSSSSCSSSSSSSSCSASKRVRIRVHCDAILFEHILWLLSNDDPSLRYMNVDELMEFYD